ncbi:MFS transporter, DHA2 family, multidrug resistance protein [Amycolatopsis tolypomycina]|uniref:MFS transporter, DHA2 family, multidrug resistance protein n=1 Tax=Amycolatopsis tolypomycina TaxID=208445 RepID=A0A1H4J3M9_9PSEU|nr:MFS transporter [Amycolatopsis tolypomycina]SEB40172.1 MFS transporter, DHA2 family, multidrug resistance protein [Amycolatopsis tolypomycina]
MTATISGPAEAAPAEATAEAPAGAAPAGAAPVSAVRAGRRAWVGLAVLALPALLVSLDVFVLVLALPNLAVSLHADGTEQLWIMDTYGFMVAGFMVTMGTLGDRIGRRKLLLIGAAAFGVASVVAAFSTSAGMLIAARAVLGIAGATLAPSTLSLIGTMFQNPRQRAEAIGIWAGCFTVGAIVGPMVGGFMLEHFWWGSVFLLGVPAMVLLLVIGPKLLPEYRDETAGRLDLPSVALSLGAILPVVYGVKELAREGVGTGPVLALGFGLAVGYVFVKRQRTLADPLVDFSLFAAKAFRTTLGGMLLFSMLGGTTMLFVAQFFQLAQHLSPVGAALGLLPGMAASTVSFLAAPVLARHVRTSRLIAGGVALAASGMAILALVDPAGGPLWPSLGFAVTSLGVGPMVALGTDLVVGSVPVRKAGAAASLAQTVNEFGYAFGLATVGTLGNAVAGSHGLPAGLHVVAGLAAVAFAVLVHFVARNLRAA